MTKVTAADIVGARTRRDEEKNKNPSPLRPVVGRERKKDENYDNGKEHKNRQQQDDKKEQYDTTTSWEQQDATPAPPASTLYHEMHDMAILSFMIFDFSYVIEASRHAKENGQAFVGLHTTVEKEEQAGRYHSRFCNHTTEAVKYDVADSTLKQSFTPGEIKMLIQNNLEIIRKYYGKCFTDEKLQVLYGHLDKMEAKANASGLICPLVLEEFDDIFQRKELVYGIVRDSINKRIVVVFRGTENQIARDSNWKTNLNSMKKAVEVPKLLRGKVYRNRLTFHSGFHDYLFKATIDDTDDIETRKYDQIMHDVKSLLSSYPDYKVYVTGHSLGGALSSITSIYFACDPNLPKPITCINFGCPKVGGWKVFEAVHYLERKQKLRIVRCINKNDCVISFPLGEYWHFGFQVTCYKANRSERKSSPPLILYMNPHESAPERMAKTWNNSLVMNFNFFYDHGDYIQRIETSKACLIRTDLTALYKDRERVGFEIM